MTHKQAERAWKWFAEAMGVADWQVELFIQDAKPKWVTDAEAWGYINTTRTTKKAEICVNPCVHPDGEDLIATLFHEGMHLAAEDVGIVNHTDDSVEYVWNRLSDLMARAYRAKVKP